MGTKHGMPLEERFWAKVRKGRPNECWLWIGNRTGAGYGKIRLTGQRVEVQAHRLSYEINVGPIPAGHGVLHRCDNRPCVNPNHLFTGTNYDNVRDAVRKGRHRSHFVGLIGESCPRAKLTERDVVKIIGRIAAGESNVGIARRFPVGHSQISAIRRGRSWKHIARD